jgi:hypothetical protein
MSRNVLDEQIDEEYYIELRRHISIDKLILMPKGWAKLLGLPLNISKFGR